VGREIKMIILDEDDKKVEVCNKTIKMIILALVQR